MVAWLQGDISGSQGNFITLAVLHPSTSPDDFSDMSERLLDFQVYAFMYERRHT